MSGDTVTIKGERKPPAGIKNEEYQCCEVWYGSSWRSITMPTAVDANKIESTYENGMLHVRVPHAEKANAGKIKVKAPRAVKA